MTRLGFEPRTYGLKVPFDGRHRPAPSATALQYDLLHATHNHPAPQPANTPANMKLETATALAIAAGLALSTVTTWRPTQPTANASPRPNTPNTLEALPPTPGTPSPWTTFHIDDAGYHFGPHVTPLKFWYSDRTTTGIERTDSKIPN